MGPILVLRHQNVIFPAVSVDRVAIYWTRYYRFHIVCPLSSNLRCRAVKAEPKEQNKTLKSVKTNVHVFVLFRLWAFRSLPGSVVLGYLDDRKINSDGSLVLPLFYLPSQLAKQTSACGTS